jgi:hypothetical protein
VIPIIPSPGLRKRLEAAKAGEPLPPSKPQPVEETFPSKPRGK